MFNWLRWKPKSEPRYQYTTFTALAKVAHVRLARLQGEGWTLVTAQPNLVQGTSFGTTYTLQRENPKWQGAST